MMQNVWLLEKERYDLYVYLSIEFNLVEDGIRPSDKKYRMDVDEMILYLLQKFNINYITISGERTERAKKIIAVIKDFLKTGIVEKP